MKLLVFLILLNVWFLKGHQRQNTYQPIVIKFTFDPLYNREPKYCCRLSPGQCEVVLNNLGWTSDSLKGRVQITEGDGWMEVKISNVQERDAGDYRCLVTKFQSQIYQDHTVTLSEVPDVHSRPEPPVTPAVQASSAPLPQSTGGDLAEDFVDNSFGSLDLPLIITISIAAMLLIACILSAVFYRLKSRKLDKCADLPHNQPEQEAVETSGIVYSTVDFRARQNRATVHKDPRMHETQAQKRNCSNEHDGSSEYSVLASHQ